MCQNKNNEVARFSFEELKSLSRYKSTSLDRFVKDLESTRDKIMKLSYTERNGLNSDMFILFSRFRINADEQYIEVKANSDFAYILNELTNEFTQFELQEFTSLKSSYSKTMYRLLKQYKSTGYYTVFVKDFRELLDIPVSYRMRDIDTRVFKPIEKELSQFFDSFQIKKIKAKKGNKIERLEFYFMEKTPPIDDLPKVPLYNWLED
ncbi:replication initiation protein [Vagococcus humatus]|uniref:replication initiation protein n=1 Tax=Vagococcus humatus TaxID=1889241 RepID=UPI00311D7F0E